MDDDALLERVLAGDEECFARLVRRYHPLLVRVARAYVPTDSSAEDAAQETWMAVVRGLERFERRSAFKTWLLRICINRARSIGDRERRTLPVDPGTGGPTVPAARFNSAGMWLDPPAPFTEIVDGRLSAQAMEAVRRAVEQLPATARAVVTLRDVEGLSTVEVATLLGLSEGNVRVVLHRGRAAVRSALEELVAKERRCDS